MHAVGKELRYIWFQSSGYRWTAYDKKMVYLLSADKEYATDSAMAFMDGL